MFGLKRYTFRTRYNDYIRPSIQRLFEDIDHIIVQQQFTQSPKEFMMMGEIFWKKTPKDPDGLLQSINDDLGWFSEMNIGSTEGKRTLAFFKGTYDLRYIELFTFTMNEFLCFLEFPMYVTEEYAEARLVGPYEEMKGLVNLLGQWGSEIEIVGVKEFHSFDKGVLTILTERQKEVIRTARKYGYFDIPKKHDSREIASKMGISHATFLAHIRKSEQRLFDALFG